MSIDLKKLSLSELNDLHDQVMKEIPARKAKERDALKSEIANLVSSRGFTLDEIMGSTGKKSKSTVSVKYQKDGNTWTGRGRKPTWLVEHLNAGGTLEQVAV